MNDIANEIAESPEEDLAAEYTAILRAHLAGAGPEALQRAHDLGDRVFAGQLSLPALAAIHHRALAGLLPQTFPTGPETEAFLREAFRPLEQALRGHGEAVARMDRLSRRLARANQALVEANAEKDEVIAELRRTHAELLEARTTDRAAAEANLRAEIGERKLTEIALRESESRFRVIFENAGIGIALLDKQGRVRECNRALQAMLGYDCEELHGRVIYELSYPDDLEISARRFKGLVNGDYSRYVLDKRFIRKDGSILWGRKSVSGVYGFRGELQFAIDMIDDVTESKLAEVALRESESRFRQITDMTCEWIWEQDAEGRYTYSSSAVSHILGYRAEEIIGKPYYELFFPEDKESSKAGVDRDATFHRLINRYRHKDGREVFTESTGTPIAEAQGRVLKWRGVDYDVTERKRFEDALRLRDRAIEASSVGIIITDPHQPDNPIIYANPAFIQMTGCPENEVLGRNPRFMQGPDTDPEAVATLRSALHQGRDCHLTLKNYRKDGTPFWNELFISPVWDRQGRLTHFIGTQTDITLLRRAEAERHELEIARQIQLSLLPDAPLQVEGARVAGYCLPAVHVGGDYFDYFAREDMVDIVIADVSGHSVGAAMIMAETRSTLKMETHWMKQRQTPLNNSVEKTLATLNDLLFEDLNRAEFFISMFYLRYQAGARRMVYANAGHNRPLLLRKGEMKCLELDADGIILGVKKGASFEAKELLLQTGDMLLLYTDGVTEARNPQGEFFGVPRLGDLLITHGAAAPQELIEIVVGELGRFCQSRSFEDDVSLVVLKVQ
jgi:sigma-B regulation protein RsbU (phosphoserine phosphatase)